ncbi:hypothetical protein X963_5617 [Burkholderia pseudomallei MSHR7498]|nr:hypothetical protein X963_5617 [Burkholderia pseudomallei MSHR7498]
MYRPLPEKAGTLPNPGQVSVDRRLRFRTNVHSAGIGYSSGQSSQVVMAEVRLGWRRPR